MIATLLILTLLQAQPADALPVIEEMPDPFMFQDGTRVRTPADWAKRREEMRNLVLRYQYGHVPAAPGNVSIAAKPESDERLSRGVRHETMRLTMGPESKLSMTLHVLTPATSPGPFPVILRFGIDTGPVQAMSNRGYAYACFEQTELDPDTEGHDVAGPAQAAYPDCDWGSVAVWAWGASRVVDYLVTRPDINAEQIVITGHSRTGKAALLAGVLDDRFALVVPNGSGCGGAAAFRNPPSGVETLKLITLETRFKSWFQKDFGQFADKETRLPFDQHFMRALVAPRFVLSTDGLGDKWANPAGTQRAWLAAQPVFDFLGVSGNNLCHFRPGGHDQLPEDFEVLLDVADHLFRGKELQTEFTEYPQPAMKPTWAWRAPSGTGR